MTVFATSSAGTPTAAASSHAVAAAPVRDHLVADVLVGKFFGPWWSSLLLSDSECGCRPSVAPWIRFAHQRFHARGYGTSRSSRPSSRDAAPLGRADDWIDTENEEVDHVDARCNQRLWTRWALRVPLRVRARMQRSSRPGSTTSRASTMLAHLLKHDSVYGPFPAAVKAGDSFHPRRRHRGTRVRRDGSGELQWGVLGVDVVLEATGRFRSRGDAAKHLEAGAKEGRHLGACEGSGRHRRARRQLRRLLRS